jgi:hypothetical protein
MPTATNTNTTPTRRGAMRLSTAALFAGIAAPALASTKPGRDAELLRLCAEFFAADAILVLWEEDISLLDPEVGGALLRRWDGLIPPITKIAAVTAAGRRAKAAVASSVMRYADELQSEEHNALVRSTLADVTAGSALA